MMRLNKIFRLFFTIVILNSSHKSAAHVRELTATDFQKVTSALEGALVMFYAPWCGACQDIKPKFMAAGNLLVLKKNFAHHEFLLVNCDSSTNSELCGQQKIDGYPTIKYYSNGEFIQDYESEQSEKEFLNFVLNPPKKGELQKGDVDDSTSLEKNENKDEPMSNVKYLNGAEIKTIIDITNYALIFFYAPWCPHCREAKPKFSEAAKKVKEMNLPGRLVAAVNCDNKDNAVACGEKNVEGYPTIRLYHNGELWQEYEDEVDADIIKELMKNPPKLKVPPTPIEEDPQAKTNPNAENDVDKKQNDDQEVQSKPEEPADRMKYVEYLTESTFAQSLRKKENSLVMFYAPWCPHCVDAKPKVSGAALQLSNKGKPNVIAAVNCDLKENEKLCEDEKIEGFPTIRHYAAGVNIKDYEENPPTQQGIVTYIEGLQGTLKDEL